MLDFGELSCNVADGIFYTKILDQNGEEIIVAIGGKQFEQLKEISEESLIPETQFEIVSFNDIGGIVTGQVIEQGTSFSDFVQKLLHKTFFPVLTPPEASLSLNAPLNVEAGFANTFELSMLFDKGAIMGAMHEGLWDPSLMQNHRAGPVINYVFQDVDTAGESSLQIGSFVVGDETLSFSASVFFEAGEQPVNSKGDPYGIPLPAGAIHKSITIRGRRRLFYGHSSPADSSLAIRSLQSSLLGPSTGTEFTIHAPIGASNIVIAYPGSLNDLSSVIHVEGAMAQIAEQFSQSTVNVSGLNGYNPITYKVFTLTPASPLFAPATFNCKI